MRAEPSILHVDLDAFFAAVEQLDDPRLRGKPVIVGGLGSRGVVSTASYEARRYGVHSAMPMARARRACPDGVFLSPRMYRYAELSEAVMATLLDVTPLVEQLSVDEAFLDVAGARRLFGSPVDIAHAIRRRVRDDLGLTASVGVASTKFLAKLATELAKPDGLLEVPAGEERAFLAPLPVSRLWGVGPATLRKLERMAVRTIGDLAALDEQVLARALGNATGAHLYALARNHDPRPVVPGREAKSVGAEETFGRDLHSPAECMRELVRLADRVCTRLRHAGLQSRTITLKVRFGNFETRTRARTLPEPTAVAAVVLETAGELLDEFDTGRGIRLLGISCAQLEEATNEVQPVLDLGDGAATSRERMQRQAAVERAADDVRDRFGTRAVTRATLVDNERGHGPGAQR